MSTDDCTIVTNPTTTEIVTDPDTGTDVVISDTTSTVTTADPSTQTVSTVEDTTVLTTETETDTLTDTAVGPQGPPGPTGAGQQEVFIQDAQPSDLSYPLIWMQTGLGDGSDFTIWFNEV